MIYFKAWQQQIVNFLAHFGRFVENIQKQTVHLYNLQRLFCSNIKQGYLSAAGGNDSLLAHQAQLAHETRPVNTQIVCKLRQRKLRFKAPAARFFLEILKIAHELLTHRLFTYHINPQCKHLRFFCGELKEVAVYLRVMLAGI